MNGFLHRLAQRANGTARLAGATAAASAGWSPQPSAAVALSPAAPASDPGNTGIAGKEPAAGASPRSGSHRTVETPPHAASRIAPSAPAPRGLPPGQGTPGPDTDRTAPISPDRGRPARAGNSAQGRHAPTADGPHRFEAQPAPGDRARPEMAPRPPGRAEASADTDRHRPPQPDAFADMAPMLVPAAPATRTPAHAPAWAQDRARVATRQVEETTEVHVSIGRIEVTALQAATPPPRKTPRAGRAPLSLDDYLARRRGQTR